MRCAMTTLAASCGNKAVVDETWTIQAGRGKTQSLRSANHTVQQTGMLGSVDIEFQGRRYVEKDGVFYGDTFTLSNAHSLNTAKVVDVLSMQVMSDQTTLSYAAFSRTPLMQQNPSTLFHI